jgi:hypothetical protein
MNAGSLIRLHGVKVFDKAMRLTHGTVGPVVTKAYVA